MDSQKRSLGFLSLAFLFITCSSAEFLIHQVTEGRETENNSSYSLQSNLEMEGHRIGSETKLTIYFLKKSLFTGVTRVWRDDRPSSKIVTIAGYSVIKGRGEPYESSVFEAAGYKWRLVLYVTGNKNDGGNGYISLYVRMEETESLRYGWEVNVDLKLFVHNPKQHKYLTVTDGAVKRFNAAKKEWGFGQLISLATFENTNQGYIVQDTCSFGAEILIVKPANQQEKVTFISNPPNNVFTWKILRFSNLEDKFYYSADFLVGDRYWLVLDMISHHIMRLGFNPKGSGGGRPHALPIFLYAQGFRPNAVATNTWGAVNLRLKNQRSSNHKQLYSAAWYPIRSGYGVGVNNIILMADLKDTSKGYLVNDAIIFEAEVVKVSVTNIVPV
ncbi:hypothetical protein HID58_077234 [Brassica napus]|uniref:MATH domain-containing protein n=1 Tax=Brassica napus TaxID=3708 RepID=A0ABQ7YPR5_BRANA|nr:hypothetical protein HID58_077234 [Brassica napus]